MRGPGAGWAQREESVPQIDSGPIQMAPLQAASVQAKLAEDAASRAFLEQVWDGLNALDSRPSAEEAVQLALDILALFGQSDAQKIVPRLPMMAARAAARLRAQSAGSNAGLNGGQTARMQARALEQTQPYAQFFALEEYTLQHDRFDGAAPAPLRRAVFVSGDAVTVLPYDPIRKRVLLVEQFRAGPFARGDAACWQLEAIAGRIDAGETPHAAALREAREEAGLSLGDLHLVAEYYPSPGAVTEYLYSFIGLCDLPDTAAGLFGLAGEGEDIRTHILHLDDLLARLAGGQLRNAPLILTALWLAQHSAYFS